MDDQTISAYDSYSEQIAILHTALVPIRIYELVGQFFIKGGACADAGCGIGRDCAWLSEHGYAVTGIDASEGMLQQAKRHYPNIQFIHDSLPLLDQQADSSFANVLCSAVIMHLAVDQIAIAVTNLVRITTTDGVMILSFRGTRNQDQRENNKLYTPIEANKLISLFAEEGATLVHCETDREAVRGLEWTNLVFRKLPLPAV